MNRGEYTWLNVSDGNNAIGIWIKSNDIADITIAGRYDAHGDTVRVTGIFNRACASHGGDFDIHAEQIELVEKGYAVNHDIESLNIIVASIMFIAALGCMALIFKKRTK
jgi:hypothetical protein